MKSRHLALLFVLALVVTFAACGGGSSHFHHTTGQPLLYVRVHATDLASEYHRP